MLFFFPELDWQKRCLVYKNKNMIKIACLCYERDFSHSIYIFRIKEKNICTANNKGLNCIQLTEDRIREKCCRLKIKFNTFCKFRHCIIFEIVCKRKIKMCRRKVLFPNWLHTCQEFYCNCRLAVQNC